MMQREVTETPHVVGADKQATAKMPTARHRLHQASVEDDPGILVAEPAPGIRGADWVHDVFLQHLRQRTTPDIECGECQNTDPGVVIFVYTARLISSPVRPRRGVRRGPVSPVWLAP